MKSAIVGYPYIGEKNEWFTIRDKFQRNTMTSSQFKNEMMKQNLQSLKKQQALLQLPQYPLTTNDFLRGGQKKSKSQFLNTYSTALIDTPLFMPCHKNELVNYTAQFFKGMENTNRGYIVADFNEFQKPPILYGDVQWERTIFGNELAEILKQTSLEVKGVIPGPISMIKSSFIREDLPYEMLLQQMTQALEEELKSFEQLGIRMIQIEEPWLFRKTSVKYREHQKNVKLEMAYLNGFVSRIREMIIVQVNTYVWKRNYNELLKSNAIDLVSLNLPNEQHLMDLCASFKSIKVNFIVNLSCFKFEGAIDLERLNHLKKYFNNRMLWFNVDLPPEDWPEQSQILKLIKKELPQLVLL